MALSDLLKEARGWLADCGDRVPESDIHLVLKVNRNCEGGWPEFVRTDPDADEKAIYKEVIAQLGLGTALLLYPQPDPTPTGDPGKLYL